MNTAETIKLEDKNKRIKIVYDENTVNPFDDDSGFNALIYLDNSLTEYGDVELPELTDKEIKDNHADLAELICHDDVDEHNINEFTLYCSSREKLELLKIFHDIKGIPYLKKQQHGYNQSDWHEIFLTAEPDADFTDIEKALESMANAYRQWAYGSVYGYIIEERCTCCDSWNDTDMSCYGFFCDYGDENWKRMISEAKQEATT